MMVQMVQVVMDRLQCFMAIGIILAAPSVGHLIDFTEATEVIQQRAGNDIKLHCGQMEDKHVADVKYHWFFKQCNESCYDFQDDEWSQLPCQENFCRADLLLRNITEKYSGLYKCTVFAYRFEDGQTFDIQLARTYQLDVRNQDAAMAVPEFVDSYPLNKTVVVGTQVVFQCRVHSEVHPTIKWFRRIPALNGGMDYTNGHENFNAHIVKHNEHTYELLSSAREKLIGDGIYLSKLILNGVNLQHAGYYACVAINYRGHKIREAHLSVYSGSAVVEEPEYWVDYEEEVVEVRSDPTEFVMLFLMPLGLAMLPVTVWLSYVIYKRCKRDPNQSDQQYFHEDTAINEKYMLQS